MKSLSLLLALAIPQAAHAKKVAVPIDVGVGPSALIWTGAIAQDQLVHYGLSISAAAVLDKKFLRQNKKLIPKQYRRQVTQKFRVLRLTTAKFFPDWRENCIIDA